ncbi:MAG: hypothetical protein HY516_00010 [Candidatus Aenigmarchaeota archaeon]|nr:hypothetical protein [Candidatus Aenigmarchaeota archaeon]
MYHTDRILVLSTEKEADLLRRDFTPVSVEINKRPYLQAMGEGLRIDWCTNTEDFNSVYWKTSPRPEAVFYTGRMDQYREGVRVTVGTPELVGKLLKSFRLKDSVLVNAER